MGIYLLLLPIWWYALDILCSGAGSVAGWIYHFFDPRISILTEGKIVRVLFSPGAGEGFDGQVAASPLRIDRVTYGLPMLAALILVTRSSWRAKLRGLGIGLPLMAVLTIPAIMAWAKLSSLYYEDQMSRLGDRSGFFYYAFHGYAFSQPVVAILIWFGLMLLGVFNSASEDASAPLSRGVRRNEPCPCGSGRKYKRCCGRGPTRAEKKIRRASS